MHTHTVTVAQAKAHLSQILGFVEAGEKVVITKRGIAIAHIEAIKKERIKPPSLASFRKKMPSAQPDSLSLIREIRDERY